jgi:hypothetical protein
MRHDAIKILRTVLPAAAAPAWGQEFRSTITGRVADRTQAVAPGVKIEAIQTETGAKFETAPGADGRYTLPFPLPGTYRLPAQAPGLKHYIREGLTIGASERTAIDIQLEVGQMAENVTVPAETPLLQTATGPVSQTVTSEPADNIPQPGLSPGL